MSQHSTVLIVEDDPGVAALQRRRLERAGHEVLLASTAAEARKAAADPSVELIVLDYRLPDGLTGLDCYTQLKQAGCDLPVIMVTGFSDEATVIEALRAGVRDFVTKSPEYLDYLPEAVARVLRQANLERQLAESESRLAAIIRSAHDAIITVESDQRISEFNAAAEQVFRCSANEAMGRPIADLLDPELVETAAAWLAGTQGPAPAGAAAPSRPREALSGTIFETHGVRADGEEFPLEASVSWDEVSNRKFSIFVLRDVTERNRAEALLREKEEQFRQAQKLESLGSLAGGVAHEFNNLLQIISGYCSLAQEGLSVGDSGYEELEQVVEASSRAASLTRYLLTFSRRQELEKAWLKPNETVRDLIKMIRPLLGASIEIDLSLDDEVGQLHADPTIFQQMLMNLCINARDAMPSGGRLSISTKNLVLTDEPCRMPAGCRPGRHLLLTVADTGHGMTAEVKRQIFEPFFTTKVAGKGTGLGLSMVFGAVQQHEGAVLIDSEPDAGAAFKIYLPTPERVDDLAQHSVMPVPKGGNEMVLVAEDDAHVRGFLFRVLKRAGYRIIAASDGQEAVLRFSEFAWQLNAVILDGCMPKMVGREVYAAMKRIRPDVPVLLCSGHASREGMGEFAANERLSVLSKPFSAEALLRALREAIDEQESRRPAIPLGYDPTADHATPISR